MQIVLSRTARVIHGRLILFLSKAAISALLLFTLIVHAEETNEEVPEEKE